MDTVCVLDANHGSQLGFTNLSQSWLSWEAWLALELIKQYVMITAKKGMLVGICISSSGDVI